MCHECIERAKNYTMSDLMADKELHAMIDELMTSDQELMVRDIIALLEHMNMKDASPKPTAPPKPPTVKETKPQAEFYMSAVRKAFFEYYNQNKQAPTAKALWRSVKDSTKYKGSVKDLRKMVEQAGYRVRLNNKKTHRFKGQTQCCAVVNIPGVAKLEHEVD